MKYRPKIDTDAITRDGRRATFIKHDNSSWPYRFRFMIDDQAYAYCDQGTWVNRSGSKSELDLIGDFVPMVEVPRQALLTALHALKLETGADLESRNEALFPLIRVFSADEIKTGKIAR